MEIGLKRVAQFLLFKTRRILFKAFIESQLKYCPLVWMFHGRQINDKISKLHERALKIVYNDTITSFEELLIKDKTFTIHHQNTNNLPGGNLSEFYVRSNHNYSLYSTSELTVPNINTVFKGQNSISYFGSVIWSSIPTELKGINSFQVFKPEIKAWRPTNCP